MGNLIVKMVGGDVTLIVPPCASTIDFTLTRPNPVPFCFVVNNGSKTRGRSSFEIPFPESILRQHYFS